ncbi:MAG: hypothetical protein ACXW5U_13045 [Thermoanaerobaculia bacterium]
MDLEFAKTLHFRELDRRVELDQAATYRVAIVGVVGGVFTYYSDKLPLNASLHWLFVICAAAALVFSTLAIIWLVRSFVGYNWKYSAYPSELLAHYRELVSYVQQYAITTPVSDLFNEQVRDRLVAAATVNMQNNNLRAALLYRASLFIVSAVVATLIGGIPLVFHALRAVVEG